VKEQAEVDHELLREAGFATEAGITTIEDVPVDA